MTVRQKLRRRRRTKIIATLGPASSTPEVLARLFQAGADVFRLNFSHGTHEDHAARIAMIRELEERFEPPDRHPRRRAGAEAARRRASAAGACSLQTGQAFRLDLNPTPGDARRVNLPHPEIIAAAAIGTHAAAGRRQAAAARGAQARRPAGDRGRGRRPAVRPQGRQRARRGAADPGADRRRTARTWRSRSTTASTTSACPSCSGRRTWPRPSAIAAGRAWIMTKLEKPQALDNLDAILRPVRRGDGGARRSRRRAAARGSAAGAEAHRPRRARSSASRWWWRRRCWRA